MTTELQNLIRVSRRTLEYYEGVEMPFVRWAEFDGAQWFEVLNGALGRCEQEGCCV